MAKKIKGKNGHLCIEMTMAAAIDICEFGIPYDGIAVCDTCNTELKYDQEEMESPTLVAKGTELFAKKIIDIAREHGVPVIENPPVARALFRLVDVNREIPPDLYKAVAEILLFVYNLRKSQKPSNIITLSFF